MGINISSNSSGDYIITQINKNDGWVRHTAVSPGDIITKVDGQAISDVSINSGSEVEITDGKFTQIFAIPKFETRQTIEELIITSIFSILALVLSILMVKSPNAVNRYFIGFLLSAALSLFASTESGRGDIIANIIIATFLPLGSLFLVLFIFALLHDKGIIQQQSSMWFKFNKVLCTIVILIRISNLLYQGPISAISANLILFYFCANVFFVISLLCYYYIKNTSHDGKIILKWLVWINVLAFTPFILLHALPFILNLPYLDDYAVVISLFIIPIGYFYLAVSKQLIDLDFISHQIPYYFLLSLLPASTLAIIIVYGNLNLNSNILYFFLLIFVTASIIVILLFIKEKVDFILRHRLWMRNDSLSQQLEFFIEKLSSSMKENDLKNLFISQLQESLGPSIIAFITFDYLKDDFQLEEISRNKQAIHLSEKFKDLMRNHKNIDLLEYQGLLGMRIYTIESTHTYIWIGYKKNQTIFNLHEKVWFINIVKYLRLVYENIFAVENLIHSIEQTKLQQTQSSSTLSRFLFQLSEQERKRLAADLHDSALQDQIICYRTLENLIVTNFNLPIETLKQLNQIKNGMQDVIQQIRTTCNELRPNLIAEVGLALALEELCAKMQAKVNYEIKYDLPTKIEHYDYNLEICIYRVIQELLNNANKHAKASIISLSLWEDEKNIYLDYRDNGKGFTPTTTAANTTHTGLNGIKERVHSFKGTIVFLTEIDHGVEIHITIPR
ncbi:sensor histidine kinase [Lysinibacillus agricola]|nr:ATP-binding protein [Lysinibacillus agricola]